MNVFSVGKCYVLIIDIYIHKPLKTVALTETSLLPVSVLLCVFVCYFLKLPVLQLKFRVQYCVVF